MNDYLVTALPPNDKKHSRPKAYRVSLSNELLGRNDAVTFLHNQLTGEEVTAAMVGDHITNHRVITSANGFDYVYKIETIEE
jgi:hypothetical protein